MAETLTPRRPMRAALAALAVLAGHAANAQDGALRDPTRPPAVLSAPAAMPGRAASSAPQQQLQSVLISLRAGGRRVAVIDGKTLREGDRVDGALVESIRPTEVVLRRGNQRQVLKLFQPPARGAAV